MIADNQEMAWRAQGYARVAGVDEVGRGPLAGPVIAAAVVVPEDKKIRAMLMAVVRDSKVMSAALRQKVAALVHETCEVGLGQASVQEIDQINIRQATFLAMRRALACVPPLDALMIDGRDMLTSITLPQVAIIKGDGRELAIGCASVVAKVARDRLMAELGNDFSAYGWVRNAGYGTAVHLQALKIYGVTPHHRLSFAPVAACLQK